MTQKIAVVIIHGIGNPAEDFAADLIAEITRWCSPKTGEDVVIRPIHWAPVLHTAERTFLERTSANQRVNFSLLRQFMVEFIGDAIAYQITPHDRQVYNAIHAVFAKTLRALAAEVGANAPLCVIAHSLGSIIASNYLYDLQNEHLIDDSVRAQMDSTPLERGDTLTLLYTLGSPIGLWSLRYPEFGKPIQFPPPALKTYYPNAPAEWVNFYDPDDVIGYPLKGLNNDYFERVTQDRAVNVGNVVEGWTPLSHLKYWTDKDVIRPVADQLIALWESLNRTQADGA